MFKKIILFFLIWRFFLFTVLALSIPILPLQLNFLGGGLSRYLSRPFFWAWSNFDGEHYLGIAQRGYGYLEEAFFPLYPLSIRLLGKLMGGNFESFNLAGLLISNLSFFLALIGLYKLVRLEFREKIAELTLILILAFPTSFYFGSVYTEGLFLALTVWSFYFFKKENFFKASLLASLASATRFVGIFLIPAFLWDMVRRKKSKRDFVNLFLIPLGTLSFMFYLHIKRGDPLIFIKVLPGYGEQRQVVPIILPQVFFRYFFRILPSLNYDYFPIVLTTYLEIFTAAAFLLLIIFLFFKSPLDKSYAIYSFFSFLIPTLTGSFSSLPRYVLVLFPCFLLVALKLSNSKKKLAAFLLVNLVLLAFFLSLFSRGYWVS